MIIDFSKYFDSKTMENKSSKSKRSKKDYSKNSNLVNHKDDLNNSENDNNVVKFYVKRDKSDLKSNEKTKCKELNNNMSREDRVNMIVSNAVASLLMSLEEDGIDSEHPKLVYKVLPNIYNYIEEYVDSVYTMPE